MSFIYIAVSCFVSCPKELQIRKMKTMAVNLAQITYVEVVELGFEPRQFDCRALNHRAADFLITG